MPLVAPAAAAASYDDDDEYEEVTEVVYEDDTEYYDDDDVVDDDYTEATYETVVEVVQVSGDYVTTDGEETVNSSNLSSSVAHQHAPSHASRPAAPAPPPSTAAPQRSLQDLQKQLEALKLKKEILELQAKLTAAQLQKKPAVLLPNNNRGGAAAMKTTTGTRTLPPPTSKPLTPVRAPVATAETPVASNISRKTAAAAAVTKAAGDSILLHAASTTTRIESPPRAQPPASPKRLSIRERSQLLARRLHHTAATATTESSVASSSHTSRSTATAPKSPQQSTSPRRRLTPAIRGRGSAADQTSPSPSRTRRATVTGGRGAPLSPPGRSGQQQRRRLVNGHGAAAAAKKSPPGRGASHQRSPGRGSARRVVPTKRSPGDAATSKSPRRLSPATSTNGRRMASSASQSQQELNLKEQMRPPPPERTPSMQERALLLAQQMQATNPSMLAATNKSTEKELLATTPRTGKSQTQLPKGPPLDESSSSETTASKTGSQSAVVSDDKDVSDQQPIGMPLVSEFAHDEPKRWKPPPKEAPAPPVHVRPNSMSDFAMDEPKRWKPPSKQAPLPEPTSGGRHSEFAQFGQKEVKRWKPPPKPEVTAAVSSARPNTMSEFAMNEPKRWKPPPKDESPLPKDAGNRSEFADFARAGDDSDDDKPEKQWPVDIGEQSTLSNISSTDGSNEPNGCFLKASSNGGDAVQDGPGQSPEESDDESREAAGKASSKNSKRTVRGWLDDSSSDSSDDSSSTGRDQSGRREETITVSKLQPFKQSKEQSPPSDIFREMIECSESYDSGNDSASESTADNAVLTAEQEYAMALLSRFAPKDKPASPSETKKETDMYLQRLSVTQDVGKNGDLESGALSSKLQCQGSTQGDLISLEGSSSDVDSCDSSHDDNGLVTEARPLIGGGELPSAIAQGKTYEYDDADKSESVSGSCSETEEGDAHNDGESIAYVALPTETAISPTESVFETLHPVECTEATFVGQEVVTERSPSVAEMVTSNADPLHDTHASIENIAANESSHSSLGDSTGSDGESATESSHKAPLTMEQEYAMALLSGYSSRVVHQSSHDVESGPSVTTQEKQGSIGISQLSATILPDRLVNDELHRLEVEPVQCPNDESSAVVQDAFSDDGEHSLLSGSKKEEGDLHGIQKNDKTTVVKGESFQSEEEEQDGPVDKAAALSSAKSRQEVSVVSANAANAATLDTQPSYTSTLQEAAAGAVCHREGVDNLLASDGDDGNSNNLASDDDDGNSASDGESWSESATEVELENHAADALTKEQEYAMAILSRVGSTREGATMAKPLEDSNAIDQTSISDTILSNPDAPKAHAVFANIQAKQELHASLSSDESREKDESLMGSLASVTANEPNLPIGVDEQVETQSDSNLTTLPVEGSADKNNKVGRSGWFSHIFKPVIGGLKEQGNSGLPPAVRSANPIKTILQSNEGQSLLLSKSDTISMDVDLPDESLDDAVDDCLGNPSTEQDTPPDTSYGDKVDDTPSRNIVGFTLPQPSAESPVPEMKAEAILREPDSAGKHEDRVNTETRLAAPVIMKPESKLDALRQKRNHQKAVVQASLDHIRLDSTPRRVPLLPQKAIVAPLKGIETETNDAYSLTKAHRHAGMALAVLSYLKHMQLDKTAARFQKEWSERHGNLADCQTVMGTLSWEPLLTADADTSFSSESEVEPPTETTPVAVKDTEKDYLVAVGEVTCLIEDAASKDDNVSTSRIDLAASAIVTEPANTDPFSECDMGLPVTSESPLESAEVADKPSILVLKQQERYLLTDVVAADIKERATLASSGLDDDGYYYNANGNPYFLDEEGTKVFVDDDGEPVYYMDQEGQKIYYESDDERDGDRDEHILKEEDNDDSHSSGDDTEEEEEDDDDDDHDDDDDDDHDDDGDEEAGSDEDGDDESGSEQSESGGGSDADDAPHQGNGNDATTAIAAIHTLGSDAEVKSPSEGQSVPAKEVYPSDADANTRRILVDGRKVQRAVSFDDDIRTIPTARYDIEDKLDLFYDRDDIKRFKADEEARKQRKDQKRLTKALEATYGAATAGMDSFWTKSI